MRDEDTRRMRTALMMATGSSLALALGFQDQLALPGLGMQWTLPLIAVMGWTWISGPLAGGGA